MRRTHVVKARALLLVPPLGAAYPTPGPQAAESAADTGFSTGQLRCFLTED